LPLLEVLQCQNNGKRAAKFVHVQNNGKCSWGGFKITSRTIVLDQAVLAAKNISIFL
jgi:hypothetical protein